MTDPTHELRVELTTSTGPSYDEQGTVDLRIRDNASGELLARVEVDPATWWRLCIGGSQVLPGTVSPNLDRVGKRMENRRVDLPPALDGDTEQDVRRDVHKAVAEQLPEDWHDFDSFDTPRISGGGNRQRYTIVRRWVAA